MTMNVVWVLSADIVLPARACTALECTASLIKTQFISLGVCWEYSWSSFRVISGLCVHLHLPGKGERARHRPVTLIERESKFRMEAVSVI